MSKKVYTILDKEQTQTTKLQVIDNNDTEMPNITDETSVMLPLAVLNHFDRVGKIIRKSVGSNQAVVIEATEYNEKRIKYRLNPIQFLSPAMFTTMMAPLFFFKALSAITGTGELNKISAQIGALSDKINRLLVREQTVTFGKLSGVVATLEMLEKEYKITAAFSPDMIIRLSLVQQELATLIHSSRALVADGDRMLERAKSRKIKDIKSVIDSHGREYLFDRQMYLQSFKAQLHIGRLWLIHDLIYKPAFVETRLSLIEQDIAEFDSWLQADDGLQALINTYNEKHSKLSRFKKWRMKKIETEQVDSDESDNTNRKLLIIQDKNFVKFISFSDEKQSL